MTDHPFQDGDKIVCVDANASYEKLTIGEIYTVLKATESTSGYTVALREIPNFAYRADRFKKAEPRVVVEHQSAGANPSIVIGPEGLKVYAATEANKIQIGAEMPQPKINPGDWIAVQGQVLESTEDDSPGDHLVEFFSHNERWEGWVRKDRVTPIPTPGHVGQCTAMTPNVMDLNVYYRCERPEHRRLDHQHKSGHFEWSEDDTAHYIEEA